jgi:hypothetical protein
MSGPVALVAFTLATLTAEVQMEIHVDLQCVVLLAAVWAPVGRANLRK